MSQSASILIVDDDAPGRAILGLALRNAGHRVMTAADGDEALALLSREKCDVMLTDAKMHPMNGFELSLRAKTLHPHLRVAMVSAVCSEDSIHGSHVEKFFEKPVDVKALLKWLAALSRPPSRSGTPPPPPGSP